MNEEIAFANAHARICSKRTRRTPSRRLQCGKRLYKFLTKHGLPLDVRYNQKIQHPANPLEADNKSILWDKKIHKKSF